MISATKSDIVLKVENLETEFTVGDGVDLCSIQVLGGVSFEVKRGKTLGIVGESGCGKSVTAMSIMSLLPRPQGKITNGSIRYYGDEEVELTSVSPEKLYEMRGNHIAMIFQEPMTALNPVQSVEQQVGEVYELHKPHLNKNERREAILSILQKVGISEPEARLKAYPHQLSGGMRQRVMIAMALACEPDILIADEPTTALDVTIQAQILELMQKLQQETGMAIIFITHDLGVVAEMCDDVVVMYAGKVAEQTDVYRLFERPCHPYTKGLLASIPQLSEVTKQHLPAVDGIVPSLTDMIRGCRFHNRCDYAIDRCREELPILRKIDETHTVSCHRVEELENNAEVMHE